MKTFFSNMKERFKNMKVMGFFKNLFSKINETSAVKEAVTASNNYDEFINSHNNIKDTMGGNVMHRIQQAIKSMRKKFKKTNKDKEQTRFDRVVNIAKKIVCIVLTIVFGALVVYAIKDVFLYCLQLVALCAATVICIEFILWVLSTAFGCKI